MLVEHNALCRLNEVTMLYVSEAFRIDNDIARELVALTRDHCAKESRLRDFPAFSAD